MQSKHEALFHRANAVMPGGVNSPVRAFNAVGGTPIYVDNGKDQTIRTVEGREIVDCCCSWGAMILGHGDDEIADLVANAARRGTTFGITTPEEIYFAEELVSLCPCIDKIRLVNSGTEAVMTAIRLARGFTGRNIILKFEGCYHGHCDAMLVSAGSGVLTAGDGTKVACAGIPESVANDTLVIPYNDLNALNGAFQAYGQKIAAVIVEPVAGNMGCIPPEPGFLETIQTLAHANGALFICDEVINAFRFRLGLYADANGLNPDIVTMGKVIGGGFPLAAIGGKANIMDALAPVGNVYQAGTLAGNPVAVAAGHNVLRRLKATNPYPQMTRNTTTLVNGLREIIAETGAPFCVQSYKTIFTLFARTTPPKNLAEAKTCDLDCYARLFHGMLERGVYIAPSQFEANFISAVHTPETIERILSAAKETIATLT